MSQNRVLSYSLGLPACPACDDVGMHASGVDGCGWYLSLSPVGLAPRIPYAGRCGNGPNVLLTELTATSSSSSSRTEPMLASSSSSPPSPSSEPIQLGHVATPNDALEVLREICGVPVSEQDLGAMQVGVLTP